jgi:predicted site-specific integrase-resolvase
MDTYSTKQVAEMVGVNRVTLQRWLLSGKIAEPKRVNVGGVEVRVWNARDVARVQEYKDEQYRKGRGRKKASG